MQILLCLFCQAQKVPTNRVYANTLATPERFDDLGAAIERAWYDVVGGSDGEKELLLVAFYALMGMRTQGKLVRQGRSNNKQKADSSSFLEAQILAQNLQAEIAA